MLQLKSKIDRALAYVHAAIEDPTDAPLRDANQHAAEVLEDLDTFAIRPELRGEVVQLTIALQTLKQILWQQPNALVMTTLPLLSHTDRMIARTLPSM